MSLLGEMAILEGIVAGFQHETTAAVVVWDCGLELLVLEGFASISWDGIDKPIPVDVGEA